MKVFLLHPDRDVAIVPALRDAVFEAMVRRGNTLALTAARRTRDHDGDRAGAAEHVAALVQDLELETLWNAMAAGDEYLYETARRVMLSPLPDPGEIVYRQRVLADCLAQRGLVERIYALAIEAISSTKELGGIWRGASADSILHRATNVLELQLGILERLRRLADEHAAAFGSEGFTRFFAMLRSELDDEYLAAVAHHLRMLRFARGVFESAELGNGNIGTRYVVRIPAARTWSDRLSHPRGDRTYSFTLPARDEYGFKTLEELRARGINRVADAAAQSADHIRSFFCLLRFELGFYLGCANLEARLAERGERTCVPVPADAAEQAFGCDDLRDVCLALRLEGPVVGSTVDADARPLVVVTGANRGGKSTFLRSVGLAQLMLQCGMGVAARSFRASVCHGLFTHFKREEDAALERGKLDEELARMSAIVDAIGPGCVLLCNESFASTNEREGSEIARQVVDALSRSRSGSSS